MIDLANTMNISPWFCIPHLADKNFIQQFAILIKNRLKPDLKLYIEYSNEIWNNQFAQSKYAKKTGCEKKLYYDCNDKTNQKGNQFWSGIYFQAKKSAEIFKIFEEELENKIDLIKILSGQAVSPKVQDKLLSAFNSPEINPHGIKADAIAIAPYIGWEIANIIVKNNEIDSITEDKIFQYLEDSLSEMEKVVKNNKIIADKFNVSLFSYEAGQHLAAAGVHMKNKVLTQKLHNANRDFRMKAIYDKMLNIWFDNEGELFVPYTYVKKYGKYGAWGLLEYQDQPIEKAYKYQAIQEYSKKN